VAGLIGMFSSQALGEYEAAVFGVEDFPNVCDVDDLSWTGDLMMAAMNEFVALDYDQVARTANFNAGTDLLDFVDPSIGGNDDDDPLGTDFADVIFFSGHVTWIAMPGVRAGVPRSGWVRLPMRTCASLAPRSTCASATRTRTFS
jgi:hypothetical protein